MESNKIELSGIFENGYGIIPKKLMRANIDRNIKLILAYMLSYTGGGNECFPSIRTMAKDLKMSTATVIKYIKQAEVLHYISKSKLYPNNPLNHANKYKLVFLDVSICKNIDVLPTKTPCINDKNSDVLSNKTPMFQPVKQNNNNNNNNNNNIYINIENEYFKIYNSLFNKIPIYDYSKNRALLKKRLKLLTEQDIIIAIKNAALDKWFIEHGCFTLMSILKESNINKFLQKENKKEIKNPNLEVII